ncbi:2'-5' RNA ligase family protein [Pedobacter frigiditerrae]|uniref:2'-5' RNA ligase family protein n=1 Tax=Pedobacter frigiditerrae TaxID=2530452 RepID=UPI0019811530|nr:2'-5' RNA ligase family protein [Pedobacter frigiditerrae]
MKIRRQLTLFVENQTIEEIRAKFNQIQHAIIPAHVTLCREDELEDLEKIIANIKALLIDKPIKISFNEVIRFDDGKGVLIPANEENIDFHNLRNLILIYPRKHLPHITLIHPRNSTCTDSIFEEIKSSQLPTTLFFNKIILIDKKMVGNGKFWMNLWFKNNSMSFHCLDI